MFFFFVVVGLEFYGNAICAMSWINISYASYRFLQSLCI